LAKAGVRKNLGSTMKKTITAMALALAAMLASGCLGYERESTLGPSGTGAAALLGNWTSGSLVPQPGQCSDFKWNVTEQSGTAAAGTFSAICAGNLQLNGTARGTLSGSVISWTAQANASVPGLASCPISLSGTAELLVDSIRIPYSGTTCLGPVSGIETLRK
jgi:hypothetical protein